MTPEDLTPLTRGEADPMVRALLRAGQRERAPAGAEDRMLTFLGVAGGAGLLAPMAWLTSRLGTKGLLAFGLIAATAIGSGVWALGRPAPAPVPALAPPAAVAVAPPPPQPEAEVPTTRIEDLPSSAAVTDAAPAKHATTAPAEGPSLAHEVALVEAARAALANGDTAAALRSLDTHDRESPGGTLMPESRVLRIEALVRAGDVARADELGDAFLAANPAGAQARRVRSVLGRAP